MLSLADLRAISDSVERIQPRLRSAVGRAAGERIASREAADVDDPAAAAPLEMRNRCARAEEHAGQVRLDDAVPRRGREVRDVWRKRPTPALLMRMSRPPNFADRPRSRGARRPLRWRRLPARSRYFLWKKDCCWELCRCHCCCRLRRRPAIAPPRPCECSAERPEMATRAPRDSRDDAVARPMPREPPVTIATWPSS